MSEGRQIDAGANARLYASQATGDDLLAGMLRPRTPIAVDVGFIYWSVPKLGIVGLKR